MFWVLSLGSFHWITVSRDIRRQEEHCGEHISVVRCSAGTHSGTFASTLPVRSALRALWDASADGTCAGCPGSGVHGGAGNSSHFGICRPCRWLTAISATRLDLRAFKSSAFSPSRRAIRFLHQIQRSRKFLPLSLCICVKAGRRTQNASVAVSSGPSMLSSTSYSTKHTSVSRSR